MIPNIPETELTAICDTDARTRSEMEAKCGVPAFATHGELLTSGLVDAVIIATPHYYHPPIAEEAFALGLHVMSEKPLGVTVGAVDKMIAAAKASGKLFSVMYQMRSEPASLAAREIVQSGALGEIYRTSLIMGWYRSQAYYDSGGWRATWKGEGGGVLINQAPHALDLFTWLAGLPATITGQTRTRLHAIEVEDEAFALLEYANGAHGYLYASTTETPGVQRLEICGDRGKLLLENGRVELTQIDAPIREFTAQNTEMWASPKTEKVEVNVSSHHVLKDHAVITQNFARAILYNEPLLAPGEEGLNAVELINGIILSGKTGKTVPVPVPRAEYDALLAELQAASKDKTTLREQRVTDPNHV